MPSTLLKKEITLWKPLVTEAMFFFSWLVLQFLIYFIQCDQKFYNQQI